MGLKSKKTIVFEVNISVINPLLTPVKNHIQKADIGKEIYINSEGAAILVNEQWNTKDYILYKYITITYSIEVDMYKIVKNMTNKFYAQISKMFKDRRNRVVAEKMRDQLNNGFRKGIYGNNFNYMAVSFKGVDIKKIK